MAHPTNSTAPDFDDRATKPINQEGVEIVVVFQDVVVKDTSDILGVGVIYVDNMFTCKLALEKPPLVDVRAY